MNSHADATPTLGRRGTLARLARPGAVVTALGALALVVAACGSSSTTSATTAPASNTGTASTSAGGGSATTSASSATVRAASTNKGTVLENSAGMPLYTLAAGTSCTGACAQAWPALTVPAGTTPKAGAGVTGTLGTTMAGGALQVTYNGKALYTFLSDSSGQVTGDGVAGFSIAKASASASGVSTNNTTTTSSGGGYKY